jgi:hypothetical protein
MADNICIVCQTNPVNPAIGKSYCSRLCWGLSLREDYKYLTAEAIKRIALARLGQLQEQSNER